MSVQPVNLLSRFQRLWPCLSNTSLDNAIT